MNHYLKNMITIDPGVSGSIAWVNKHGEVMASKCPGKDIAEIFELYRFVRKQCDNPELYIERQTPRPTDTSLTSFVLSGNYHTWQTTAYGFKTPTQIITPAKWQGLIGTSVKGLEYDVRKKKLHMLAKTLFPNIRVVELKKGDYIFVKKATPVTLANCDALMMIKGLCSRL